MKKPITEWDRKVARALACIWNFNGDIQAAYHAGANDNIDSAQWHEAERLYERLERLRGELRAERISYGELAELQGLAEHISPDDVELREAAGLPEEL